jgi:hypothetical protein
VVLRGTGAGAALDVLACASSPHAFGFFLCRATPSGGFGVTRARHDERREDGGKFGEGTRIANRARNCAGVLTRWVSPRRGVFPRRRSWPRNH